MFDVRTVCRQTAIVEAGGVEAVLQAMSGHAKDVDVAQNGCDALAHLALCHPDNQVGNDVHPGCLLNVSGSQYRVISGL